MTSHCFTCKSTERSWILFEIFLSALNIHILLWYVVNSIQVKKVIFVKQKKYPPSVAPFRVVCFPESSNPPLSAVSSLLGSQQSASYGGRPARRDAPRLSWSGVLMYLSKFHNVIFQLVFCVQLVAMLDWCVFVHLVFWLIYFCSSSVCINDFLKLWIIS